MISTLPLSPPVMKVAQFLDCNEQLIMSFLEANGAPFKWLFSENWNFYYRSLDSFASSPSLKPRRSNLEAYHQSDLWQNLERFFQFKSIRYKDVPLKPLVRDVVKSRACSVHGWPACVFCHGTDLPALRASAPTSLLSMASMRTRTSSISLIGRRIMSAGSMPGPLRKVMCTEGSATNCQCP